MLQKSTKCEKKCKQITKENVSVSVSVRVEVSVSENSSSSSSVSVSESVCVSSSLSLRVSVRGKKDNCIYNLNLLLDVHVLIK